MKTKQYEQQIKKLEQELKQLQKKFSIISLVKLFHALFIIYFIYLLFSNTENFTPIIICGLITIILVAFWIYHDKLKQKIDDIKGLINIYLSHLDRISGAWVKFPDVGSEFINHDHPYSSDLDIVGKKSIFQFLNTTQTWHGRIAFVNDLLKPNYTDEQILKRQEAILELSEDIEFAAKMNHQFSKVGVHGGAKSVISILENEKSFFNSKILELILTFGPLLTIFAVGALIITRNSNLFVIAVVLVALQVMVLISTFIKSSKYLDDISGLNYHLEAYADVIKMLNEKAFASSVLNDIQNTLNNEKTGALTAINQLAKIMNRVSIRRNSIAFIVLNILFLYDVKTSIDFSYWRKTYSTFSREWFTQLGIFESLLAFSNVPNVVDNTVLPTITTKKQIIAKNIGHPLINHTKRVCNDITNDDEIFIISGSNMSGKTTFMRTIGINIILARAGGFVCASKFSTAQFDIMTSMRIADDLSEGISTFYAELKRIKMIINSAKQQSLFLFLIDEIFRGTNSIDRLEGAKTVLEKLNELHVNGMITTHDLELCGLSNNDERIKNYSFCENYAKDEILFDYKVKPGVSYTTNAKYLMNLMDII